jgi:hypothetical protein
VVVDPAYSTPTATEAGAVYLYDGATHTLISRLVGARANDQVGTGGVVPLPSGNFVVLSPRASTATAMEAGAATWVNGSAGLTGTISTTNSLFGQFTFDMVGSRGVTVLANGNYIVASPDFETGKGAATWGSGTAGVQGVVSGANSLVGSALNDYVASNGVLALANGNYVVNSPNWNENKGAVTWADGATGIRGVVAKANSLVGNSVGDRVGEGFVIPLTDGDYVVGSPAWQRDGLPNVGAATWGNGTTGITGVVTITNSLVGSAADNAVGWQGLPLTNGHYVVRSYGWNDNRGAVTWGSGDGVTVGEISATNSLVGTSAHDAVGLVVVALTDGGYVVGSPVWDRGTTEDAGAATWCAGDGSTVGEITALNSLVGSATGEAVGEKVVALANNNYVVLSQAWGTGRGAATWGSGDGGTVGEISALNSLVGTRGSDSVGGRAIALTNGNYVVLSPSWGNGALERLGAATWCKADGSTVGEISPMNSLIGSNANDQIGFGGGIYLHNGNYAVASPLWDGAAENVGAVTWGDGTRGITGTVSAANSLVGSTAEDFVGGRMLFAAVPEIVPMNNCMLPLRDMRAKAASADDAQQTVNGYYVPTQYLCALPNGNYVATSPAWDNGNIVDAGAVTLGDGRVGIHGPVSAANSVVTGVLPDARAAFVSPGMLMVSDFSQLRQELVVGRPYENIVTIAALRWPLAVSKNGTGTGVVTSSPAGIDCGAACAAMLNGNRVITLTATADATSDFTGWSAPCVDTESCVLTMDQALTVTATFMLKQIDVVVPEPQPQGAISVTVVTAAADLSSGLVAVTVQPQHGAAVTADYPYGTVLRFTALSNDGFGFVRWTGLPSETQNPQEITVTAPLNVTAEFAFLPLRFPVIWGPVE